MGLELRIIKDPCRDLPKPRVRTFGQQGGDIGRAPESYWVLPDPKGYLSAQHCDVKFRDGAYWLRDTSRNGVYLNGAREPVGRGLEVPLRHGDRVRLAEYELLVRVQQTEAETHDLNGHPHHQEYPDASGADTGEQQVPSAEALANRPLADRNTREANADLTATVALLEGAHPPEPDVVIADVSALRAEPAAPVSASGPEPGPEQRFVRTKNRFTAALDRLLSTSQLPRPGAHSRPSWDPTDTGGFLEGKRRPPRAVAITKSVTFDPVAMEQHCVLLGISDTAAFNSYKILRTRIRRRMAASQWRSMGVSGASEGVGKTLTALNLGIVFAYDPRSPAVLVDLDLYRPRVASYLGISFDKGLTDYLLGEAEIGDIIYSTPVAGLTIIPSRRPLQNASELLASQRMSDLVLALESLRPQRTLIYDLPPLLMSDDVLIFSPHMDCLLDVVGVGVTPRAALERSKEVLSELSVVGCVVNRAIGADAGYYYYYK